MYIAPFMLYTVCLIGVFNLMALYRLTFIELTFAIVD